MKKLVEVKKFDTYRLIKQEDLNHHGTLFAGRMAEWFVEAGFIAAATVLPPEEIVCVKLHGLHFGTSATSGQTIRITSRIAHLGTSSIMSFVEVRSPNHEEVLVDGFLSFVHVNAEHRPVAHDLELALATDEDRKTAEHARFLQHQSRQEAALR